MYYVNLFFISSFLGYLLETGLKTFVFHSMNNGIMMGPWIPVYGFGCVIIVLLEKFIFKNRNISKLSKLLLLFLSVSIILTFIEWLGGILIEICFDKIFWDYSKFKFNFGHYIALEMSIVWGVVSIFFVYFIKPLEDLLIKKIPKWISILVSFVFVIDFIYTIFRLA